MNSPTHSLIALALLTRKGDKKRNWAVFAGSIIPDAFIYLCWVWLTFVRAEPQEKIWGEIYFNPPMQLTASLFNSVPIFGVIAVIGWIYRKTVWGVMAFVFALAALIHIAMDFPVHGHDAYAHFWPLTMWKFHAPLSYWEVDLHANWVGLVEALLCLAAIYVLWRRFSRKWVRFLLALCTAFTFLILAIRLWSLLI